MAQIFPFRMLGFYDVFGYTPFRYDNTSKGYRRPTLWRKDQIDPHQPIQKSEVPPHLCQLRTFRPSRSAALGLILRLRCKVGRPLS
jgi:hypothetical protein